jgi:fatty-acyl-CoA synthase
MFHVNAWGLPYTALMVGAKLVLPGPHLDPASLVDLLVREKVTVAAGVPTLWIGIRDLLDASADKPVLEAGLRMIVGGSAAPERLIRDFDRLGMRLLHAWGMTETSPIGLVSVLPPHAAALSEDARYALRAKQGVPPPLVEIAIRNEAGQVPRDDKTSGELMIRSPWVAARYVGNHSEDRWTADGFFRTGDVARVDALGFVQLTDRVADMIKSGGEWISSQELENALMGHPAVREAAVIGVSHPKWSERPIAVVVLREGKQVTGDELRAFIAERFAKFWLPDAFEFVDAIPRTSAGKFLKTALRERFRDRAW